MDNTHIKLYDLLTKGSHDDIKKKLLSEIYNIAYYCENIVGEGFFGKVKVPAVGPYMSIKIDNNIIVLPVVIKEAKANVGFFIDEIDKTLIINSTSNMTCEALILFILSKAWYKEQNLHLPFLMGLGSCNQQVTGISHIILEKCGLPDSIVTIDRANYFGNPHTISADNPIILSYLSNIAGLVDYLMVNQTNDMMCLLPNEKNIHMPEIIDNICIFYLHTTHFLWEKFGLTLGDQHVENVFIHWINAMSRCGKRQLNNLEYISYDVGKSFIKVKTHGMIYKIGDVGISVMNVQKTVMILGNISNGDNMTECLKYKNKCYCFWDFILNFLSLLPPSLINKTIISKIIDKHNIGLKYIPFIGLNVKYQKDFPNELDILNDELYNSLRVSKPEGDDKNFVVNL